MYEITPNQLFENSIPDLKTYVKILSCQHKFEANSKVS